ncbi:hypothetical protein FS749_010271 [Ceratobasidium sp. UAMH 11750]|nr:hypothetical protein FS749_010271 [Ceratobasidium sp. UAMH 11750]
MPASALDSPGPNQNDSITSSSNSNTRIVAFTSAMRKSANTLGLPGLSEITSKVEDITKMLCDEPTTGLSVLAERVQFILQTLRSGPLSHREETKEATRELEEILRRVNSAQSGRRLISAKRFDEYDELSKRATSQMEALNLQHMQKSLAFIENAEAWQAGINKQVQLLNQLLGDHTSSVEACASMNDKFEDKVRTSIVLVRNIILWT